MNAYTIFYCANKQRCDMPNYRQWVEARDSENFTVARFDFPGDGEMGRGVVIISEQVVFADSPEDAIANFRESMWS